MQALLKYNPLNWNYSSNFDRVIFTSEQITRVTSAASYALKKFSAALVINLAIRFTFATFLVSQGTIVFNIATLAFTIFIVSRIAQLFFKNQPIPAFFNSIARSTLVTSLTMKINNYIHEYGHAIAAHLSYINAKPEIFANFSEGSHRYAVSYGLTRFGQFLGEQRARLLITASGLMTPIFMTVAEFALAYGVCSSPQDLHEILIDHGFSQLAHAAYYSATTFFGDAQLENDFYQLWQMGGLHPLLTITLMLAIPIAQIILLDSIRMNHLANSDRYGSPDKNKGSFDKES
jgi:hypothetical protein